MNRHTRNQIYGHYPPVNINVGDGILIDESDILNPIISIDDDYLDLDSKVDCDLGETVEVYISTSGSDTTGNGTSGSPWYSPHKAIHEMKCVNCETYVIWCSPGTYTFDEEIVVLPGAQRIFIMTTDTSDYTNRAVFQISKDDISGGLITARGTVTLHLAGIQLQLSDVSSSDYGTNGTGNGLVVEEGAIVSLINTYIYYFSYGIVVRRHGSLLAESNYYSHPYYSGRNVFIRYIKNSSLYAIYDGTIYIKEFYQDDINSTNIQIIGSSKLILTDSTIYNRTTTLSCIAIVHCSDLYMNNSDVYNIGSVGIYLQRCSRGYISTTDILCSGGGDYGILLNGNSQCFYTGSDISNAANYGIYSAEVSSIRINSVTFTSCAANTSPAITTGNVPTYGNDMGLISS